MTECNLSLYTIVTLSDDHCIYLGPDQPQIELVVDPALSQSRVEEGRLVTGIGTHQQDQVCVLHAGDLGVRENGVNIAEGWCYLMITLYTLVLSR